MKNLRTLLLLGCSVYWGTCLIPKAKAGEWDWKSVVTFGQPVEIPGVVLPAGIYVFNFLGSTAARNLIEVRSQDEQKLCATIEAIPDYHWNASGETSIVYEERKAGAPHAIKEWYFPDRRYGHEFVYPETGTLELGKDNEPKVTTEHSKEIMQPEETAYWRVLHQKQAGSPALETVDQRKPESGGFSGMSYLEALHQKQIETLQQSNASLRRQSKPVN
jgi:hypothetical protein